MIPGMEARTFPLDSDEVNQMQSISTLPTSFTSGRASFLLKWHLAMVLAFLKTKTNFVLSEGLNYMFTVSLKQLSFLKGWRLLGVPGSILRELGGPD